MSSISFSCKKRTAMNPIEHAFNPESFRTQGHLLIDTLADRLAGSLSGQGPVCSSVSPAEELAFWTDRFCSGPEDLVGFLGEFAARSIHLHHPHYMGHQVCAPAPSAALAGLAAELLNNGMAVYEMGPAASALEKLIIQQTATLLGMPNGDGFLTSGGTLAMLTALLGARARQLGDDILTQGTEPRWAVMASEEAHYCTARAAQVMGWGREGVVLIPSDEKFKVRIDLLETAYEGALKRGRTPIAFVGSACSTSTGAYDDLNAIADFCARRNLWFHVDGAHGAAVAFCPELRDRISGIERADSLVLDFHKLLLTPALATAVIFQRESDSWAAFHERAQYLWNEESGPEWYNYCRRTYECTKLSMSVKIAAILRTSGTALFNEHLRTVHSLAKTFAAKLRERPPFEVALEPESNIVCFRWKPPTLTEAEVDHLNAKLRHDLVTAGQFYIVQTVLRGRTWLRTALMNPFTKPSHLDELLESIEALAGAR
jgi:L-2,4-diaminobutyrate decarboxylase